MMVKYKSAQAVFKINDAFPGHFQDYHQTSDISHTLAHNKIVDHSDVVVASPVGAAPTTSSRLKTWLQWLGLGQLQDEMGNI